MVMFNGYWWVPWMELSIILNCDLIVRWHVVPILSYWTIMGYPSTAYINYVDRCGVCFCNSLTTLKIVLLLLIDFFVEQPSSTTSYWDSSHHKGYWLFDCYRRWNSWSQIKLFVINHFREHTVLWIWWMVWCPFSSKLSFHFPLKRKSVAYSRAQALL